MVCGMDGSRRRARSWTALATDAGGWRQINRAGQPMIQPIFNPDDGERSSAYNTTQPREDRAIYGPLVSTLVAGVVAAMGTSADPQVYGELVAALCFPDILRYEVGTPAVFGFAKRNGRALADNAPEVMFSIVVNAVLSDRRTAPQRRTRALCRGAQRALVQ
jgi:hypothetical protein